MLVGELDENVFETRLKRANFPNGNAILPELLAQIVQVEMIFDERVNGLSKNRGAANPGNLPRESQGPGHLRRGDLDAFGAVRLDVGQFAQRVRRAVRDELAIVDVSNVAAAFRFIHVMRGDKKRDAVAGKLKEEIPKLAARDGIDPGGGLVKEKKLGLVQHGATQREPLLPAAGKLRGQPIEIRAETIEL